MNKSILKKKRNYFTELSLNRSEKLNVLNHHMVTELHNELLASAQDDSVNGILLSGEGTKGFCAGGDVVSIFRERLDSEKLNFFKNEYELDLYIHQYNKPIVSLCHGVTMGGGAGLINGCRFKVFDSKTIFSMPEVSIGFFPDVASSYFLNLLPKSWCLFLALTGGRLNASLSFSLGLCDYVVDQIYWSKLKEASSMSEFIMSCKEYHNVAPDSALEGFCDLEAIESMNSIEAFNDWAVSYINNDKGHPWIKESLGIYFKGSPLSAKIIWSYFTWARGESIESCFEMDYRLCDLMLKHSDFSEGVRALLVDKDKNPRWMFQNIRDISKDEWSKFNSLFN